MSVNVGNFAGEEFVETLRSMAECPVCITVPRGGKFYLCQNSHSICESCYKRLSKQDHDDTQSSTSHGWTTMFRPSHNRPQQQQQQQFRPRQCPLCRGRFPARPMKNRTLERLIDEVKFEFPCSFAKNGCDVKDMDAKLRVHELDCPRRDVQCPKCRILVPFSDIRQHLLDRHPDVPPCEVSENDDSNDDDVTTVCLESWLFGRAAFTLKGISAILSMTEFKGQTFCPAIYKTNDHWYIWIYVLGSRKVASNFSAELSMEENGLKIAGPCPVIAVDERLDDIMRREETLEMSNRLLAAVVDREGVTGVERRAGYFAKFSVRFVIRENKMDLEF